MNSELALLIERSAELKGDLVRFGHGPRFERAMDQALLESAGPDDELDQSVAISVVDHFLLQLRLPNGQTVLELFVASRPDLSETDREMLLGWRDPVEGFFEIRRRDGDGIILLNLLDDLEYRTYSNVGRAALPLVVQGRISARPSRAPPARTPKPGSFPGRCRLTASLRPRWWRRPRSN